MPNVEQYTPQQIIQALEATAGLIGPAAKKLGCSPPTVRRYRDNYPEVKEALHEIRERNLDMAELKLMQSIRSGHVASIIFYLKTLGKSRGFVERVENVGLDSGPIVHLHRRIDDMTDEEAVAAYAELIKQT